jgi:hypothetical protein
MAEIVLGIGASHGPMLVTTPDQWALRLPDDRRSRHPWRGRTWSFDELVEARAGEGLAAAVAPDEQAARAARCRQAIGELARVIADARIDVAVIFGNDQMEIFEGGMIPALAIHYGREIVNAPFPPERMARLPPGIAESVPGYIPEGGATYKGHPALGRAIIEGAVADGFDVTALTSFPKVETPHAYGFVYRHLMNDAPVPTVPVVINTFYPPNQPTFRRCWDLGRSVAKAVKAWESEARVAFIASGGLSHFAIDEDVDRLVLDAMSRGDLAPIAGLGEATFQAGTSEIKNWAPVAGAMAELGLTMTEVDYVPVYRSEAGTGNAMGFVYWR